MEFFKKAAALDRFSGCRATKKSLYLYHNFIETWGT